jgi:hypothetical protein
MYSPSQRYIKISMPAERTGGFLLPPRIPLKKTKQNKKTIGTVSHIRSRPSLGNDFEAASVYYDSQHSRSVSFLVNS